MERKNGRKSERKGDGRNIGRDNRKLLSSEKSQDKEVRYDVKG